MKRCRALPILFLLLGLAPGAGRSARAADDSTPRIAVLPIANHTRLGEVRDLMLPRLYDELTARGLVIVTSGELRPLLRRHRIRTRNGVGRHDARILAAETGARYFLLGSWDVFRANGNPEIGLSLRILDVETMRLVRSVSTGATGEDFTGLLDQGRITEIADLADRVTERAVAGLLPLPLHDDPIPDTSTRRRIAVVPLDDFSGTEQAGAVVTGLLVNQLVRGGFDVIEPGFVHELVLSREVAARGRMDRSTSRAVGAELGARTIITGAVDRFAAATGNPRTTAPHVAFGLRVLDPEAGTVQAMWEIDADGDDSDGFFQRGRIHALVPLAASALDDWFAQIRSTETMGTFE